MAVIISLWHLPCHFCCSDKHPNKKTTEGRKDLFVHNSRFQPVYCGKVKAGSRSTTSTAKSRENKLKRCSYALSCSQQIVPLLPCSGTPAQDGATLCGQDLPPSAKNQDNSPLEVRRPGCSSYVFTGIPFLDNARLCQVDN